MAVVLGLLVALAYGTGDFFGGLASKRNPATAVVFVSQVTSLGLLVAGFALVRPELAPGRDLLLGALAGLVGIVGLVLLYRGLANGTMSVVAPIPRPTVMRTVSVSAGTRIRLRSEMLTSCKRS